MTVKVQFNDVSKRYQLGLTRTSLPTLLSSSLQKLRKRRAQAHEADNEFWALAHVNFELDAGQSLALVGANGAGKTTILKLLSKITTPTSGTIKTDGKLSALIELGAGFHPDLTGRENIFLNGAILGIRRTTLIKRVDEIIDFAELDHFIDTPVKRYSSGMIVRLGFAVASCIEPEILLVDEVLAVGDALFQQKCMQRIRNLLHNGTSIIFVSHNFYLIQAICQRALYLEKGQVKLDSRTKEVIDLYEQDLHKKRVTQLAGAPDHPDCDGRALIEITRVEVLGIEGRPVDVLPSDQPAEVRIHYHAYQAIAQLHASAFIMRADGLTCCMVRTKLDDVCLTATRGQGFVSLFLEPLQLVTGAYYAEAWFLNESDSMAITPYAGRSDWFQVRGRALSYANDSGIFQPHSRWQQVTSTGQTLPVLDYENGHARSVALTSTAEAKPHY